jgi:hypothetical protein
MRRIGRGCLQRQTDRLGDLIIPDPPRRTGARFVMQPIDAALGKAPAPFADGVLVGPNCVGDHLIFQSLGSRQHNPRPPRQALRCSTTARQPFERGPLSSRQPDCNRRLAHRSCLRRGANMISHIYRSGH